ncbi:MAG: hypothetical protein SOZ59_08305 [Candidatus Limivivens sp.]|nr:hypothetical protein [Candidatus Limivivens sp.]
MNYTTYYEECETVTEERYGELKCLIEAAEPKKKFQSFHLRKLEFRGANVKNAVPQYYLCVKNRDENEIFLEKKYQQNGIHFKKCARLTREECDRILRGDVEWMKSHKKSLFMDFYRQVSLNHLSPGRVTDYEREMLKCRKEGYVTFTRRIDRATGQTKSLFTEPEFLIPCLDEGKVLVTYKKEAILPAVLVSIMQIQEDKETELAYIF